MNKWKIVLSMITATLFVAAAAQAQTVIYTDTFESGVLAEDWDEATSADVTIADDGTGTNNIVKVEHVKNALPGRTQLNINRLEGMNLPRFDLAFDVKVFSTPAPAGIRFSIGGSLFATTKDRFYLSPNFENDVPQDEWINYRLIGNNSSTSLTYDQGGGISGTVATNTMDIYTNGVFAQNVSMVVPASENIEPGDGARSFGFIVYTGVNDTTFYLDDVTVRDLEQTEGVFGAKPFGDFDSTDVPVVYPGTSTNAVTGWYHEGPLATNVQISSLTVSNHAGSAFSAAVSAPHALSAPSPNVEDLVMFNATGFSHEQSATASVEVVWSELGGGSAGTVSNIVLYGTYYNWPAELVTDPSDELSLTFRSPATSVTGSVDVSYTEAAANPTNVEVTAVSVINASHGGFSASGGTGTLASPAASASVEVVLDNSVAGLGENETATADLQIIWQEVDGTTTGTNTLSVSATRGTSVYMELDFASGADLFKLVAPLAGFNPVAQTNYTELIGNWNYAANLNHNTGSGGYLQQDEGNAARASYTLIQNGTAGMDDIGIDDTVALTSGLYQIDFTYEALASGSVGWGIAAYGLENQDSNGSFVNFDVGNPRGVSAYTHPVAVSNAVVYLHENGMITGTSAVSTTNGSVVVSIADGADALFGFWAYEEVIGASASVRLYDVTMTRVGDYVPQPIVLSGTAPSEYLESFEDGATAGIGPRRTVTKGASLKDRTIGQTFTIDTATGVEIEALTLINNNNEDWTSDGSNHTFLIAFMQDVDGDGDLDKVLDTYTYDLTGTTWDAGDYVTFNLPTPVSNLLAGTYGFETYFGEDNENNSILFKRTSSASTYTRGGYLIKSSETVLPFPNTGVSPSTSSDMHFYIQGTEYADVPVAYSIATNAPASSILESNVTIVTEAGFDAIRIDDAATSGSSNRVVGQTFSLSHSGTVSLDAVTFRRRPGGSSAYDSDDHTFLIAVSADTDNDGEGDTLLAETYAYSFRNASFASGDYVTFYLGGGISGVTSGTYQVEVYWAEEDPDNKNFVMQRSQTGNAYAGGKQVNKGPNDGTFPLLEGVNQSDIADFVFFIHGASEGGLDFASWAADNIAVAGKRGANDDADDDGMDNLLEYALGSDPEVDDDHIYLPTSGVNGSFLDYVYNRRTDYVARTLDYIVETDSDLVMAPTWTNDFFTEVEGPVDGDFQAITNRIDTSTSGPQYFIRLRVEEN